MIRSYLRSEPLISIVKVFFSRSKLSESSSLLYSFYHYEFHNRIKVTERALNLVRHRYVVAVVWWQLAWFPPPSPTVMWWPPPCTRPSGARAPGSSSSGEGSRYKDHSYRAPLVWGWLVPVDMVPYWLPVHKYINAPVWFLSLMRLVTPKPSTYKYVGYLPLPPFKLTHTERLTAKFGLFSSYCIRYRTFLWRWRIFLCSTR